MNRKDVRLLLLDVSGLIYRSFFALPPLTSPSGAPSGALFGYIRSFLKIYQKTDPTHVVAIFDGLDNKKSRLALYAQYKGTRKPMPDELISQMAEAHVFCQLWGIPELALPGVEADDSIAAVTALAVSQQVGTVSICSADKDLTQLLQPNVVLIRPGKEEDFLDELALRHEWKLEPSQIGDYLALVGDSSDNVPGVDGIGPKTAQSLLSTWKTLDAILDNVHLIPGRKGELLRAGAEAARLSRKLVALDASVPVPQQLDWYRPKAKDVNGLKAYFQSFGFHTLQNLLEFPETAQTKSHEFPHSVVQTTAEFAQVLEWLSHQDAIVLDTESTSLDETVARLVGIGLTSEDSACFYIDCTNELAPEKVVEQLSTTFQQHDIAIIGHNIKYDLHVLLRYGMVLPKLSFDTLIASWLLHANERTHSLQDLAWKYFNIDKTPIETLIGKGKAAITMAEVPVADVARYCTQDVGCTLRLKKLFEKELEETSTQELFSTVEMPLIPVLLRMELNGVFVDVQHFKVLKTLLADSVREAEQEVFALAGKEFVINSPKQLSQVLFSDLGLPKGRTGKQFASTSAEILEDLSLAHPIASKVLEYRQLEKLRSTYVDALPKQIRADGRIHCHFVQSGTATGRLSCQDPNLQNIPTRSTLGKEIRAAFRPQKDDWVFISADYSQIELRLLAHITKAPSLVSAFIRGQDIHALTAAELNNIPLELVTGEMRRRAKAVNFGIIYGQQAFGLSKELHISTAEAQRFIDRYFDKYHSVREFLESIKAEARLQGYASTLTGRRRYLPDINSSDFITRSAQERLAVNMPFQGTAADIIKMAMISIDQWLIEQKMQTKMIVQIHDELLFEAPSSELDRLIPMVRSTMESVMQLLVPLKVEISIGKNWKEC